MRFVEAFIAIGLPTGVAVWALYADITNHYVALVGWCVLSILILGWFGINAPLSGKTADETSHNILEFYAESGASSAGLIFGFAAGVVGGLVAGDYARSNRGN